MHVLRMLRQHQLVTEVDSNILMEFRDRSHEELVSPDLLTNIIPKSIKREQDETESPLKVIPGTAQRQRQIEKRHTPAKRV